ncbi:MULTISPECIES: uracil-xanthine permease family protein [unclassified Rummeliibacillus]|uniref:uracil-xanthine permease family protein n=1 Tax=unclassified Rummeliibacillus TaxID=2622809 RepID=UPI000E66DAB6|nr:MULTISPECIES: solute carrier family 23 protein [unclassified Rummeliibacillus]RIJ69181.1 uracil permease [Rummeliibacillus sp. POC4]RPJ96914.1 uracil permease [Rummeliibacillus sp. TYF005]
MSKAVLDINDKPKTGQLITLSLQHMFAMFGSTILVPTLTNLSPAIALLTSGIATLVFLLVTKFKVPAYLGSSFAFIAPIQVASAAGGPGSAMIGAMAVGLVYGLVSLFIWKTGYKWIMKILPPIVVAPVIMVIGLGLAVTAVNMAMYENANTPDAVYSLPYFTVALITLIAAIICNNYFKGVISTMPILIGMVVGYIASLISDAVFGTHLINFNKVIEAKWIQAPDFLIPGIDYDFNITSTLLLAMVPIVIVTISEHIGHQLVLGKVVGRNFIKEPGLNRSLLGDGLGTLISSLIGGPPKTTYGENIGVLVLTRVFSVWVIGGAAVSAIILAFSGKLMTLVGTIPTPVLGGVSILLFGIIASSGLRMLVENKIDFDDKRNLVIASVILILGIGGAKIIFSETFSIQGMALAAIVGVVLNLILPGKAQPDLELLADEEQEKHKKN